jgi:hypothetical protein
MTWSSAVAWDVVCRRASGRRRYNAVRRLRARVRRRKIIRMVSGSGAGLQRGDQARLARRLHVSEATISRDLWQRIFGRLRAGTD